MAPALFQTGSLTAEKNGLFPCLILTLTLALKQTTFKELNRGFALSGAVER